MVLLAVGTVGILFGISNASASLAARTWAPIVIGVAALGAFTVVENRSQFPAFPVGLFRTPVFLAATFAGLAWNGAESAAVLQLSNLWQYIDHYSTVAVSLGELPFSILAIGGALLAWWWSAANEAAARARRGACWRLSATVPNCNA